MSRWAKSSTTYGPVGRLLWTAGLLGVEAILLTQSLAAVLSLGLWTFAVLPVTLRQIWKPARRG